MSKDENVEKNIIKEEGVEKKTKKVGRPKTTKTETKKSTTKTKTSTRKTTTKVKTKTEDTVKKQVEENTNATVKPLFEIGLDTKEKEAEDKKSVSNLDDKLKAKIEEEMAGGAIIAPKENKPLEEVEEKKENNVVDGKGKINNQISLQPENNVKIDSNIEQIVSKHEIKQQNIKVPSEEYIKNDAQIKKINENIAKKENKENKKKSREKKPRSDYRLKQRIVLIAIEIAIVLLVIFVVVWAFSLFTNSEYKEYTSKMDNLGLSELYNNSSAKYTQYVTKGEAIKLIIATLLNTNDISSLVAPLKEESYLNETWINYAKDIGIITDEEINENNCNDKITYIDILSLLSKAEVVLNDVSLNTTEKINFSNADKLSFEQKAVIRQAISNGIIENNENEFNIEKKVTKGLLNKTLVQYVKKSKVIAISDENITFDNANYPYTLESYGNNDEMYINPYNIEEFKSVSGGYKSSIETYKTMKQYYKEFLETVQNYYNVILNINSNTITEETFLNDISKYVVVTKDTSKNVHEYVEYVKNNNININGNAKVVLPVIYYDGLDYRVRTEIKLTVESANNLKNVLYMDLSSGGEYEYSIGNVSDIIDVPVKKLKREKPVVVQTTVHDIFAGSVKESSVMNNM